MSLGNPTNIIIIALLGLAAILFILASFTGGGKWRRLYQEESEDYAAYADRADQDLRDARQRIAELERANSALQQRLSEAETVAAHTEIAVPAPVVVPVETPVMATPEPHPIVGERATITELPPAPIMGVTPLRAEDPVEVSAPVKAETHPEEAHAEVTHAEAPEHPEARSSTLGTIAHLAEGAALAEVAHLAWNAYSSHKHHAEEHAAEEAAATHAHATPEHVAEAPHAAPAETVVETADLTPAAEAPAKAWFGSGKRDDLMRMRGVDTTMNTRLFGLGITSFDDIVHLSQEDEMALEQRLGVPAGYITREQWREQASLLRFGKDDEFNERFGG